MLPLLNNLIKGPFKAIQQFVTRGQGDNALATIKQLNDIINALNLNSTTSRELLVLSATHPIGQPLSISTVACNCVSGSGNCPSCLVTPCAYKCGSSATLVETLPGIYDLVITPNPEITYYDSYILTGALGIGFSIAVDKITPYHYSITTYANATGVITTQKLNKTPIEIVLLQSQV
jgi:hypothetical protein